jgi:hypothetical protein
MEEVTCAIVRECSVTEDVSPSTETCSYEAVTASAGIALHFVSNGLDNVGLSPVSIPL